MKKDCANNSPSMIVFTDLDGTLLDHHSYAWQDAKDCLQLLEQQGIPVIFNTSKTSAELLWWREQMNNRHPFIAENGSAVYIPKGYPITDANDFEIIQLGAERQQLIEWLNPISKEFTGEFKGFNQLSLEELIDLTHLPENQAILAMQREYSEAIYWHGDNTRRRLFIERAEAAGWKVLVGGRFLHILGQTDKGKASDRLFKILSSKINFKGKTFQGKQYIPLRVACGDSHNDIDMLDWADLAVIIRSPVNPLPNISNKNCVISNLFGPQGWAETIQALLSDNHRS